MISPPPINTIFNANFSFSFTLPSAPPTPHDSPLESPLDDARHHPSRPVSPCSSPTDPWSHHANFSLTDLAAQMATSRLVPDTIPAAPPAASSSSRLSTIQTAVSPHQDDADCLIPPPSPAISPLSHANQPAHSTLSPSDTHTLQVPHSPLPPSPRPYSPARRAHRQRNTLLLSTSTSHARDLSALVTGMVERRDQCCIALPTPPPSMPSSRSPSHASSYPPSAIPPVDEISPRSRTCSVAFLAPAALHHHNPNHRHHHHRGSGAGHQRPPREVSLLPTVVAGVNKTSRFREWERERERERRREKSCDSGRG